MFCKCQTEIGLIVVNIHNYFYVISFHFDTPTKFVLYFSSNMSNYMHWAKFMEIPISVASTSKVGKLVQLWSFFNIMKVTWIFIEFLNDCKNIGIKKTITFPYFSFHIEFEREREKYKFLSVSSLICPFDQILCSNLSYARHYNPRFIFFQPTFWKPFMYFQRGLFWKFYP